MPSYQLVQFPRDAVSNEEIAKRAARLDVKGSKAPLKEGVIPSSIHKLEDSLVMELGFEYMDEIETIDGMTQVKRIERVPAVILSSGFLFMGSCIADIRDRLQSFFETNFVQGVVLGRIKFDETTLRTVIDSCAPDIVKLDVKPSRQEEPDQISATGRRVYGSPFYETYGEEPLEFVKVRLVNLNDQPIVGFRRYGTITISSTSFTLAEQASILRYIVDRVIGPYLARTHGSTFQTKLEGR